MRVLFYRSATQEPGLLEAALQDARYELDSHDEASAAWQAFARHHHPLVVVDARTAATTAADLCRRLKQQPPPHPFVLAWLDEDPAALDILVAAGIDDFLTANTSARQVAARLQLASLHVDAWAQKPVTSAEPTVPDEAIQKTPPAPGEERFRRLVEMSPDMVALHAAKRWLFVNRAGVELLAAESSTDLLGSFVAEVIDDAPGLLQDRSTAAESSPAAESSCPTTLAPVAVEEGRLRRLDGTLIDVEYVSLPSSYKGLPATQVMVRDISPRKRAEEALKRSERRYRELFEGIPVGVYRLSQRGELRNFNRAFVELLAYPDRIQLLGLGTRSLYFDDTESERWRQEMKEQGRVDYFETRISRFDDKVIWVRSTTQEIRDPHGQLLGYEGTAEDITDRKTVEERLIHDALHDGLTQLPNRVLFMDRLNLSLEHRFRKLGYHCAVLFLDLDRFKMINDSFGHAVGDQLLVQASQRLRSCLRPTDTLARLGGDEFAILLDDVRDASNAVRVAKRVQKELRAPFHLEGREVYSSASIGIALSSKATQQPEELLRDADIAMYRAKQKGRAGYAIFDAEMHEQVRLQLNLETDFRRAVESAQLEVYYQPIIDLQVPRVAGFEALLRWQHPQRGLVAPSKFLPLAEDTRLIHILGRQALDVACRQAQRWNSEQWAPQPMFVSVNLSPTQFAQHDLLRQIEIALEKSGLDASQLRLEINEKATLVHPEAVLATLQYIKELGVHLCLDNFGTGYSSLSVLHRFPFDSVKIDRWLVRELERDENSSNLIEGMLSLCHWHRLETLAQGIENAPQRQRLVDMQCHLGQGYLFSAALPAHDLKAFLDSPLAVEATLQD